MALEETGVRLVAEDLDSFLAGLRSAANAVDGVDDAAKKTSSGGMKMLERGMNDLRSSAVNFNKTIDGARKTIQPFKEALGNVQEVARLVQQAFDATVGSTVEYAKQVRDLGRELGTTAENASMLIEAADDVKVSFGTLQAGMRAAIRKGFSPTLEGLGEISDQYLALPPGIERAKFAMDTFGRSGAELGPLLEKGSSGIRAMGQEARDMGLVLDDEAAKNARRYEELQDTAEDYWTGITRQIGVAALPQINNALESTIALLEGDWQTVHRNAARSIGLLPMEAEDATTALQRLHDVEAEFTSQTYDAGIAASEFGASMDAFWRSGKNFGGGMALAAEATAAATVEFNLLREAMGGALANEMNQYDERQGEVTGNMAALTAQLKELEEQHGRTYTATRKATRSEVEVANAAFDAETAAMRLAAAQQALATNTDPEAQRGLQGAVLDAQLAFEGASTRAGEYQDALGGTYTATVNNKGKIEELRAELLLLQAQYFENAAAHREATKRILFDLYAQAIQTENAKKGITGFTREQATALDEMAGEWGLVNEVAYTTLVDIQDQVHNLATTGDWQLLPDQASGTERAVNGIKEAVFETTGRVGGLVEEFANVPRETIANVRANTTQAQTDLDNVRGVVEELDAYQQAGGVTLDIWARIRETLTREDYGGSEYYTTRGGGRASGGRVGPQHWYTVGERGPEMFIPDAPGVIVPNRGMAAPVQAVPVGAVSNTYNNTSVGNVAINVPAQASPYATGAAMGAGLLTSLRAEGRA